MNSCLGESDLQDLGKEMLAAFRRLPSALRLPSSNFTCATLLEISHWLTVGSGSHLKERK